MSRDLKNPKQNRDKAEELCKIAWYRHLSIKGMGLGFDKKIEITDLKKYPSGKIRINYTGSVSSRQVKDYTRFGGGRRVLTGVQHNYTEDRYLWVTLEEFLQPVEEHEWDKIGTHYDQVFWDSINS